MRQWLIVLAATAIMVLGFLATLVLFADQTRLKQLLASHVEMQTGRQLSIDGGVSVRFFPRFRIEANQVRLSGPRDFDGPELASAEQLTVEVRLLPLIQGRLETREVTLQGARLQVAVDDRGEHSLAGLMRRPGRAGAPGIVVSGPLRLEDVELEIGSLQLGAARQIQVDRVELDGLAFDRALSLDFRGAIGRPPVLSDVNVNGVLIVPVETGRFRLTDMRFSARHAPGGVPFELLGAMSFSAVPPLTISLEESRFRLNGQELVVSGQYAAQDRPQFGLTARGTELDLRSLSAVFAPGAALEWPVWLANWVAEHDIDFDLAIEQLMLGPYMLPEFSLRLAAAAGHARMSLQETSLPGALMRAEAEIHTDDEGARIEAMVRLDVDDLGLLLRSGNFDLVAEGAGQVRISPGSGSDETAFAEAELEIFDGRLPALEVLRVLAGVGSEDGFDTLSGRLLLYPDAAFFPAITVRDAFSEIRLQGVLLRRSGRLSGTALVLAGDDIQQFELSGSSALPEFAPIDILPAGQ